MRTLTQQMTKGPPQANAPLPPLQKECRHFLPPPAAARPRRRMTKHQGKANAPNKQQSTRLTVKSLPAAAALRVLLAQRQSQRPK